jgi:hypothetical protein
LRARDPEPSQPESGAAHNASPNVLMAVGRKACEAAGIDEAKLAVDFMAPGNWLRWGADPERDIYPTIAAVCARKRQRSSAWVPKSLNYFDDAIVEALRANTAPVPDPFGVAPNGNGQGRGRPKTRAEMRWDEDMAVIERRAREEEAAAAAKGGQS